jgi:hypothetical protein
MGKGAEAVAISTPASMFASQTQGPDIPKVRPDPAFLFNVGARNPAAPNQACKAIGEILRFLLGKSAIGHVEGKIERIKRSQILCCNTIFDNHL